MKNKYISYNFNEKIEYKIYINIGQKYYKDFMHKKIRRNKDFYKFNKFLDWKEYFVKKYSKGYNNDCNFIHYLFQKCRKYQQIEELNKCLVIPLCIAIVTIIITIYSTKKAPIENLIVLGFNSLIVIEYMCISSISKARKKVYFFNDCIDIMNKIISSHQK